VLKRLERAGFAERLGAGRYELSPELTKKTLKAARKHRKPVLS
jgi:DNA-binding IclR family transcriptional regulator